MSSNITGNPSGIVAPMVTGPTANQVPVIAVPSDGDAANAASVTPAPQQLVNHMALLMLIIGGTRTAKALAVDATGGSTVSTTAGCITAAGDITATGRAIGAGITPTASAGSTPVAATLYKDLVPWAWAKMAWTGSVYQMLSSAGFDMTYNGATGWAKLGTGIVDFRLLNVPPGGDNGTNVMSVSSGGTALITCGSTGSGNPKVFIFNTSGTATDGAFNVLVFAK